jgi:LPXTG-site transpeptidase (sortase) family protein
MNKRNSLEENKNLWKILILVFISSLIVLNWNDIYWVFNPKVAPQGIQTLISQEEVKETGVYSEKENSVEIPLIGIAVPVVETEGESEQEYLRALDQGVVLFPDSVNPGEKGLVVLLGHSAPPGWPKIKHDWVFSEIDKLEKDDEIIFYFNKREYLYKVTEKIFLEIGQEIPQYSSDESEIILLSCWPPGKNIRRIGVRGVLTK